MGLHTLSFANPTPCSCIAITLSVEFNLKIFKVPRARCAHDSFIKYWIGGGFEGKMQLFTK